MSNAYFIVLNQDEPDFDSFVDGKLLTSNLDAVNKLASDLGLKAFDEYAFQDLSEFGGPEMEIQWFDAADGNAWATAIANKVKETPNVVSDSEGVLEDLADYIKVFEEAQKRGLKWHLELDF